MKITIPSLRYTLFSDEDKRVSHIVWHAATGHWPEWPKEVVRHIDDNPFNNELGNLQLMTTSEHRTLHTRGSRNPRYGKIGEDNPNWKGDAAIPHSKYMREWRARKRDRIPEQEVLE